MSRRDLAARIRALSPERRELLMEALAPAERQQLGRELILPQPRDGAHHPASSSQRRIWFASQLRPDAPLYNMATVVELRGRLDVPALQRSLDALVRRHEALRTTIISDGGEPRQHIQPPAPVPLPLEDLTAVPATARARHAEQRAVVEARRSFDLAAGPLLRLHLLRLGDDEHWLVTTLHHVIADGWSIGVLVRELTELYRAEVSGTSAELPALPIQYLDFAGWQREQLESAPVMQQLDYWRARLDGATAPLELPADRARPAVPSGRGGLASALLGEALSADVRAYARRAGATPFMVLLAAWSALLHRYTGATDLCIGTPIANRNHAELEGLIGVFVNTLVLRLAVDGDDRFAALVARTREVALAAYANQDVPFERVVEALGGAREASTAPIAQIHFGLQNAPLPPLALPGLTSSVRDLDLGIARVDVALWLEEGAELKILAQYNADLFDRDRIVRLIACYRTLLAAALAEPEATIAGLPLMDAAERRRLDEAQRRPRAGAIAVQRAIEAQAAAQPDAIALRDGDETISYGALGRRANRLARQLRTAGVCDGARVGVDIVEACARVVAELAALKAGAVAVSFDPGDAIAPSLRLDDAALAEAERAAALLGDDELEGADDPARVAMVVRTLSGTPAVTHEALGRLPADGLFAPGRRVACTAHPASAASAWLTWAALSHGAELVTVAPTADAIAAARPDVLLVPATRLHELARTAVTCLDGVGALLVTAGRLDPRLVARVQALPSPPSVHHLYGLAELGELCGAHLVQPGDTWGSRIAVGRPVAGAAIRVVDEQGHDTPIGVPGRVLAGSAADAALRPTGDRGRWRHDHTLELLGRSDETLCVRGFRVDPADVEQALARLPDVAQAWTCSRDVDGARRLVAWLVMTDGARPSVTSLRAQLKRWLPEPLMPWRLVLVDELPLAADDTVDEARLPPPVAEERAASAPADELERTIAALWRRALKLETVDPDENFFDLGGHSLLLAEVQAGLRATLGVELPIVELLRHPTVRALAQHLRAEAPPAGNDEADAADRRAAERQHNLQRLRQRRGGGGQP